MLISRSRCALSGVHANLSYRWVMSVNLLLWARTWCQSHVNPQQLHCSNWQHSICILMGLRSQTCLLLRNSFDLLYIHPIECELHLPAIPFPLDWFPWKRNLCSLRIRDFSLARICQASFFWELSGSSCIPRCMYPLAEVGSNTETFFAWDVGGKKHCLKKS